MKQNNTLATAEQQCPIILSIGHAHELIQSARVENNFGLIKQIGQSILNQDEIIGDANDYHNLSVEFSRLDDYATSFQIVEKGLQQFPFNIDLLADAIFYGSNSKQYEKCECYIKKLRSAPFARWNWRAFTFLVDYYLDKADWTEDTTQLFGFSDSALEVAKAHQLILPTEEKGYLSEFKIRTLRERYFRAEKKAEKAEEESKLAENALKQAIESEDILAVQCCSKYADFLFEKQRYSEVISVCDQALQYGESQSSAKLSYFLYLSGQSKDVLIHREKAFGDTARVQDAFSDYMAAYQDINSMTFRNNIKTRSIILAAKSGVPLPEFLNVQTNKNETNLSELLQKIL